MAKTNRDRIAETLQLLHQGLYPFVERQMREIHGDDWKAAAEEALDSGRGGPPKKINWEDPHTLLLVLWNQWNAVFGRTLGHAERSLVSELREVRNKWAHNEGFTSDDTYRALDTAARLLNAVSAPEATEVDKRKAEVLRLRFEEQLKKETRQASLAPVAAGGSGKLTPWREVVTPHPDVATGRYQQAEFAADLWQVYQGEGTDEYRDPEEFFRRTFITAGLKSLLVNAVNRLGANTGDPVVELQTNFGGGKTHSMLALYHLCSGGALSSLHGVHEAIADAEGTMPGRVRRAVIVGVKISPGMIHEKPDGTRVRTLWGEIAWQLGGKDGYELVREADETSTSPGDALRELFNRYSPCVILIDEWVAYARQLSSEGQLPAGTFDTQFTFAQALTEAAKAARNTLLVVSVPASESPSGSATPGRVSAVEIGGERGKAALARLKNAMGRVEASWRPASPDEGFEIVRRRLFRDILDPDRFVQRDLTMRTFSNMYRDNAGEFPRECGEGAYERRMKAAYPIHPELFDRLYGDWSTLDRFQRTRGVLRLMASVIHRLWDGGDSSPLIMPSSVPIDDPRVRFELTRYLDDQWDPVIETDVDGPHSSPAAIDRENPRMGERSAARRAARSIFMGSAPTFRTPNKGIDETLVKLGCVQPGETPALFGDALRRLSDRATHLYVDGGRYWYSTQPSVSKMAEDRAGKLRDDVVLEEMRKRLREEAKTRGEFAKVHACAAATDVPDERETRLVIIGPDRPHIPKIKDGPALKEAETLLTTRGNNPRTYRNTLVFIAADKTRVDELESAVRTYLAWKSIYEERESLNLDTFQTRQAETKMKDSFETVSRRIPETYVWLLVPVQGDPKGDVEWREIRVASDERLALKASKKLVNDELLLKQFAGTRLRMELDRIPLWRGNHVSVRQLIDDFASYVYLPRLKSEELLVEAIRDGVSNVAWTTETFAYADAYDEAKDRYLGLKAMGHATVSIDGRSVVVKPSAASAQMERDEAAKKAETGGGAGGKPDLKEGERTGPEQPDPKGDQGGHTGGEGVHDEKPKPKPKRFYLNAKLDPLRSGRDASLIQDEIVRHFAALINSKVEITIEVRAEVPDGMSEQLVRTIAENCRTLRYDGFSFEEE
jgi:predicted AAA+ superfamily ATPase